MKFFQNLSYKTLFAILFFTLAGIVFFIKIGGKTEKVSATWWDDMWHYRKAISITNSSGSNLTDFQVAVSIGTSQLIADGKMQSDCDDIRLTDINGNLLPYWIEENNPGCNSATGDTKIWLKANSLPTSGATVYIYYGNSQAVNNENGKNVFLEFDDFKNSSNINNWTLESNPTTTYSISGGTMSAIASSGDYSSAVFGSNYTDVIVNSRFSVNATQSHGSFIFRGQTNAADNSYQWMLRRIASDNRIQKRLSGGQTYLLGGSAGIALPSTLTAGNWYPVEFRVSGTTINTYFNNLQAINGDFADTEFSSGKIGILSYDGNEFFDYIFVRKYASTLPTPSVQSEETGGGPIAYWKFDEGSGSTAYDSIGTNNGTITGTTWQNEENCFSGKCLFFNGTTSDYVNTNFGNGKDMSSPLSISMWVKPASPAANKMFLGSSNGTNQRFYFATYNGKWSMGIQGSSWDTQGTDVTLGQWHHVEITMDGSTAKMFINNKLIRQKSYTPYNLASNILIGWGTGSDYYWNGYIDDVKIYPYVRTADQIKLDYNSRGSLSGSGVNMGNQDTSSIFMSSGLVGYWKMEEGIGNTTLDSSGNNNTATFSTGTSAPSWVNSKYGIGISFNTGGYLSIGTSISGTVWSLNTQIKYLNKSRNFEFFAGNNANTTTGKLLLRHNGYIAFYGSNGTYYDFSTPSTDIQDSSKNISFVSNGITISLYVDGVFKSSVTPASTSINIHQINNGWTDAVWTAAGIIDELRIYNRALSAIEVNQLYQNFTKGGTNIRNSLMAYYKFDENNGTTVYDSSGNNLNGTFGIGNSSPSWTQGKVGRSLSLDGTNDTVTVSGIDNSDNFTASMWIYPKSNNTYSFFEKRTAYENGFFIFQSGGVINFDWGGSVNRWNTGIGVSLNQWSHIAFIRNPSGRFVYINGKLSAETSNAGTTSNISNLNIGWAGYMGPYSLNGLIDEVKIYNTALTADEIKQDYNAGSAVQFGQTTQNIGGTTTSLDYCIPGDTSYCASPVAEWKMDEGVGTSIVDTSGSNNTGTISGATFTQGKIGKALSFNGTNNYVSIPTFSYTTNATISVWVKGSYTNGSQIIVGSPNSISLGIYNVGSSQGIIGFSNTSKAVGIANNFINDSWNHLSVVIDNSGNATYYCNGQLLSNSGTNNWSWSSGAYIGRRDTGTYFKGQIDQLKIYNYARTPAQIAYDYNKGGPVGWWKFDECQGNIAYDWSGIGNTGVISIGSGGSQNSLGTCAVGTSAAWTNGTNGKINSSLNFDGTDDYINCGSNISTPNEITFLGWIKPSNVTLPTQSISAFSPSGQYNYWLYLDNKSIQIAAYHTTYPNLTIPNVIQTNNVWYHIAFTATKGGSIKVFINGIKIGEGSAGNTYTASGDITIGDLRPDRNLRFPGQIDDVRIYNYALTSEQIKQVYNGGAVNFQ